ncbi:serine/threonine protein kinase [Thiorhodococcus drewsii AZ1]|uniref:Serine/threonine protein kinase n=1 Tax=Thiorhodococcus drewsii AZ1 TaxID=765913 RepID=G2DYY7_9GAMM|nr:serine/threonine-protein kinase [Thiorhodococcus drewsii]EGV32496.1 serine/threonine protein kinase [Thiorhodococcus drewsii AZ1]
MDEQYRENLGLPGDSKFEGIGFDIPVGAVNDFFDLLEKIAGGSKRRIESFQISFNGVGQSSDYGWATSDLQQNMRERSNDAAFFMDSLWLALRTSENSGAQVPPYSTLNKILQKHQVPLSVSEEGNLEQTNIDTLIVADDDQGSNSEENIQRLQIGDKLGQGGYGVVFKATRSTSVSKFEFAVKLLDPSPFVSDRSKALKRFQREVKAIQALDHRAIIQYVEAGVTSQDKPYLLMPLIRGLDIRTRCGQAGADLIVQLFAEVLTGLSYAHASSVIHRDLKPSNILVRTTDTQPVILDFGSAYLLDHLSSASLTTAVVGTIGYIPSEVLADPKKRSALQDIYACGVMLYEAVCGRRPDPANYLDVGESRPELRWIDPIIKDAIAGEKNRMTTAKEFAERLRT